MTDVLSSTPVDQLRARLDDPEVAASLNALLDNVGALAVMATMANGFLERGDTITENVVGMVHEVRGAAGHGPGYLVEPARKLVEEAPAIADAATALIESGMFSREVVGLLGRFANAAVEGVRVAEAQNTSLDGVRATFRALRDPDVARGLGMLVEVARAIGKTL
ncbi:MAG: DUF1641 domain-containing protein [Kineosporiaceae bacterium]|jgi:uncharacterized protein YjgD (DUF1641 family)|nr:DUF1641 domain-containing protein [Kineosporiaceae bacterium]MBK7622793.1 DUF1641 domain-containing protein [Kineosporiaceae bacterium]MBK8078767.1 DUF1641 domain-containing protein [Kineosporiaceae bacterium]